MTLPTVPPVRVTVTVAALPSVVFGAEALNVPGPWTSAHEENSDVSLSGSVAVAVIEVPGGNARKSAVNVTLPDASVLTGISPRNVFPSVPAALQFVDPA